MSGTLALWITLGAGLILWGVAAHHAVQHIHALRGTRVSAVLVRSFRPDAARKPHAWRGVARFQDPLSRLRHEVVVSLSGPGAPGGQVLLCYPVRHADLARELGNMANWQFPIAGLLVGTVLVAGSVLLLTRTIPAPFAPPRLG